MKRAVIVVLSSALALAAVAVGVELWVRATWDSARGRPGLFIGDAARIEKLAPGYDGWYAGVPVHTNSLAFRDPREYDIAKRPNTFRILVFGDSVTFGHGSLYESSYPYLLEQKLRGWRTDVDWQVWNLGVPGYSTAQELMYLRDVGPAYRPDLVIVAFFENDVLDDNTVRTRSRLGVIASRMKTSLRRRWYSVEWYRRLYEQARLRWVASAAERRLAEENAAAERVLFNRPADTASLKEQRLTDPAPLSDAELASERCPHQQVERFSADVYRAQRGFRPWLASIRQLQALARSGEYRLMFFINAAPRRCQTADLFDARGTADQDAFLLAILGVGVPAVSSHDAFLRYRPSQMPNAGGHSVGNSNAVKAGVLFAFLKVQLEHELKRSRES